MSWKANMRLSNLAAYTYTNFLFSSIHTAGSDLWLARVRLLGRSSDRGRPRYSCLVDSQFQTFQDTSMEMRLVIQTCASCLHQTYSFKSKGLLTSLFANQAL